MSRTNQGHQYFITVFSPEGKLYQVEYAFKAVKTAGLTGVGVKGKDCAVLICEKKIADKYIDPETVTSIHSVTAEVGAMAIGLAPDSKNVIKRLQLEAAQFKTDLGYDIPIDYLALRLADYNQLTTQKAMQRVFGVEVIIAGVDIETGPSLLKVDPAGYVYGYKGTASGVKEQDAINFMEKELKKREAWDLDEDQSIKLAITALQTVIGQEFKNTDIQIGVVSKRHPKFKKLSLEQVDHHLREASQKD